MTTKREDGTRPFADFIREQARGATHDELSELLAELVRKVDETGKAGTLTYSLKVSPIKGSGGFEVTDQIKAKMPEFDRGGSIFFATKNGALTRDDPNQPTFESLREVPGVGVVDDFSGEVVDGTTSN